MGETTKKLIDQLSLKINEFSAQNKTSHLKGVKSEFPILIENEQLVMSIVLNSIKQNTLANMTIFYVDTYPKTMSEFKKQELTFSQIFIQVNSIN